MRQIFQVDLGKDVSISSWERINVQQEIKGKLCSGYELPNRKIVDKQET